MEWTAELWYQFRLILHMVWRQFSAYVPFRNQNRRFFLHLRTKGHRVSYAFHVQGSWGGSLPLSISPYIRAHLPANLGGNLRPNPGRNPGPTPGRDPGENLTRNPCPGLPRNPGRNLSGNLGGNPGPNPTGDLGQTPSPTLGLNLGQNLPPNPGGNLGGLEFPGGLVKCCGNS